LLLRGLLSASQGDSADYRRGTGPGRSARGKSRLTSRPKSPAADPLPAGWRAPGRGGQGYPQGTRRCLTAGAGSAWPQTVRSWASSTAS